MESHLQINISLSLYKYLLLKPWDASIIHGRSESDIANSGTKLKAKKIKIAVIDHIGNHGGGSRVVRSLLPALKKQAPNIQISYFGSAVSIARENLSDDFGRCGIDVVKLRSLDLGNLISKISSALSMGVASIQSKFLSNLNWVPLWISGNITLEIERRVKGFDLVFYPWPFLLKYPKIHCKSVAIFHDFNFKYYFGGSLVFSQRQMMKLGQDMPEWLANATPIVSSKFIEREMDFFYPQIQVKKYVVHLPSLGASSPIDFVKARQIVKDLSIEGSYILCPTHMCSHKNHGPLIAAVAILNMKGRNIKLVFTGAGTERIGGHASILGVQLNVEPLDIIGLGYVSNLEIDSLIQCAAVVVNPSLYEAGNGPGLDAWALGAPVAMSDIGAFREHIAVLDVRAQLFDPHSPSDIAEKIAIILANPSSTREDVEHSLEAMKKITWEKVADEYLRVFHATLFG
jgi:glycosyltransferase involved in cell wall biosynthesis